MSHNEKNTRPRRFSETSINALKLACQLAMRDDAGILLLHVNETVPNIIPVSEYAYTASAVDIEEYDQDLKKRIQTLKSDVLKDPCLKGL